MPRLDHFDLLAPIYDRILWAAPEGLGQMLNLPTKGALLDLGGGTGRVTAQFAGLAAQVIVVDTSRGMLRRAAARRGLRPILAAAEGLPFADGSIARIVMVDTVHHLLDVEAAFREAARVLAPEGRLLIGEPNWRTLSMRLMAWAEKLAFMRSHPYPPETIVEMARRNGLLARSVAVDKREVWIVADKPAQGAL